MLKQSFLTDNPSQTFIIFVGDWIRQEDKWFQVVDVDGSMQFKTHDGRWLWADVGDVDEVLSDGEFRVSGFWDGKQHV